MKKIYVKPEVYFESFELSNINHTVGACWQGVEGFKGFNIFVEPNSCKTTPDDNGLCYHSPTDANNIFTS